MSKSRAVKMCCHCGMLFPAGLSQAAPNHHVGGPLIVSAGLGDHEETPLHPATMCPGAFDVCRNPYHDRRTLQIGDNPPGIPQVDEWVRHNLGKRK